jgi:glycosyltransferase involved in cell wall biosynthesis
MTGTPPPLRVLSVIDSLAPGGAERSLVELALRLPDHGIEVRVAVLADRRGFAGLLTDAGIEQHTLPPAGRIGRTRALHALVRATRPDLVHTTLFEADVAGRSAAAAARTAVVSTLANVRYGPEQFAEPGLSASRLRAAQALDVVTARAVTRFHAVSTPVAEAMADALHVRPDRIEVVPRGRDAAALGRRDPTRRHDVRRRLGLEDHQPLVVVVARQEHQKGLDLLVDAARGLLVDHPELRINVAGSPGRASPDLRSHIDRAGLGGVVELLGARDDVADLLVAADAFVLPSRREGFPGAVVEAMALETPVVVSDLAMTREAIPDADHGILVLPGSASALSDGIREVLDHPEAARARARLAHRRYLERFTIERTTEQMAALFRRAASAGAPSPTRTRRPQPPSQP